MYNRIGKRILDCIIGVISLPFLFVIIVIKAPIIYLMIKDLYFIMHYDLEKMVSLLKCLNFEV